MTRQFVIASGVAACKLVLWAIAFVVFARASRVPRALRRGVAAPAASMLIRDAQAPSTAVRS
jgi:hypothetical protein